VACVLSVEADDWEEDERSFPVGESKIRVCS
jgi:hypothetical protein